LAITIAVSANAISALAADDTAVPAQPLGKGHAQDRTRPPAGGGSLRRLIIDALDRELEILHPRRKHIAEHAPGFLDIEFPRVLLVLHQRRFPRFIWFPRILKCVRPK
jgi:hypothetical protein